MALQPDRGSQSPAPTSPALSGVWVAIAAITMSFAASLRWLGVTMILGAIFAILHIREWAG
jgi:heme/copper-type cytochrome/quinol oxidase subunit 3